MSYVQLHTVTPTFEGKEQYLQHEVSDKERFPIVIKPFSTKFL